MDTLFRNPAFLRQTLGLLTLAVLMGALAFLATSWAAQSTSSPVSPAFVSGVCTLVAGIATTLAFCLISHRRYTEITRLSTEIDAVLHDGRNLSFSDYREGDVAVLRNEVDKVCARLTKTAEDLAAEKRALSDALADISHQIRTPLTAVELLVPVIERVQDSHVRSMKLHELETLIDRVSWLVTSLLKIARIDANAITLASREQNAKAVIDAALEPLEVSMDMHGVSYETDVQMDAAFLGDAAWTAEALSNVLKNCMEHTPEGGCIRIQATEDSLACRFRIQDTGPGISDDDLPHVFERFYRGEPRNTAPLHGPEDPSSDPDFADAMQPGGFGIGLSLAQALINAQGGSIRASNAPGGGAQFDIVFPKMTV